MISKRDLFERPELYEPLGTVKSVRNKASVLPVSRSLVRLFTSDKNRFILKNNLYRISKNNGSNDSAEYISDVVDKLLNSYLASHDIENYRTSEYQATGIIDYVALLRHINIEFLKYCHPKLKWNQFNPFREWIEVGASDDRKEVRYRDVSAADIPTINVWANQDTTITDKKYRHRNAVPFFQAHMHQRHYDRSNEGFKVQSANESSLEAPVRAYDMSAIHQVLGNWTDKGWFGL